MNVIVSVGDMTVCCETPAPGDQVHCLNGRPYKEIGCRDFGGRFYVSYFALVGSVPLNGFPLDHEGLQTNRNIFSIILTPSRPS
jgi:hypothetical protein